MATFQKVAPSIASKLQIKPVVEADAGHPALFFALGFVVIGAGTWYWLLGRKHA